VECFELQQPDGSWLPVAGSLLASRSLVPLNPIQNVTFGPTSVALAAPAAAAAAAAGVRYSYADAPADCNLYSTTNLPAGPFVATTS